MIVGINPKAGVVDEEEGLLLQNIDLGRSEIQRQLEKVYNSTIKGGVPFHGDEIDIMFQSEKYLSLFCLEHLLCEDVFGALLVGVNAYNLLFGDFGG